jgi:hypothetical protein
MLAERAGIVDVFRLCSGLPVVGLLTSLLPARIRWKGAHPPFAYTNQRLSPDEEQEV